MITRRKSLIIVSGKIQNKAMPILANHEGLVEIKSSSEIPNIWHHNKTPIIKMRSFQKLSPAYAGDVIVFNTDELLPSLEQNVVTDVITKFCYGFKIEPGEFKVMVGSSYEDIRLTDSFFYQSDVTDVNVQSTGKGKMIDESNFKEEKE